VDILVLQARNGDQAAFRQLVEQNQKAVYNIAYRMCGSREDAQDMAQEAFLKAWKNLPTFKEESSFSTWVYRITVNTCADWLRRQSNAPSGVSLSQTDSDGRDATLDIADMKQNPETELTRRELARAVGAALAEMPADYRQAIVMRENAGMSYEQIGQILHIKPGMVKSRIFRAREFLRKKLVQSGNFTPPQASNKSVRG